MCDLPGAGMLLISAGLGQDEERDCSADEDWSTVVEETTQSDNRALNEGELLLVANRNDHDHAEEKAHNTARPIHATPSGRWDIHVR